MSTTTIKLFIFFVLIIKIVNCGICFSACANEDNDEDDNNNDAVDVQNIQAGEDGGEINVVEQGNVIDLQEGFGQPQNNQQLVPFAVFAQQVIDHENVEGVSSESASSPFSTNEHSTSTE